MPRIALLQLALAGTVEENRAHCLEMIGRAAHDRAQVLLLPELCTTPFFPAWKPNTRYFEYAETIPGPTTDAMAALARRYEVTIVAPLFERVGRSVYYNSAAVLDADGSLLGTYRKHHIPLNPIFAEKLYFKPGNLGYPVFDTRYGKIGVYICHDRHYPEGARCLALGGAEVILIPSATNDGSLSGRVWDVELRAHAIFNEIFVAGLNRVGVEIGPDGERYEYYGRSLLCGSDGEVLGQLGNAEDILAVDVDFSEIDKRRIAWQFYRDRRPDSYGLLTQFVP
jgi:N-carbamoylputrescine amidase